MHAHEVDIHLGQRLVIGLVIGHQRAEIIIIALHVAVIGELLEQLVKGDLLAFPLDDGIGHDLTIAADELALALHQGDGFVVVIGVVRVGVILAEALPEIVLLQLGAERGAGAGVIHLVEQLRDGRILGADPLILRGVILVAQILAVIDVGKRVHRGERVIAVHADVQQLLHILELHPVFKRLFDRGDVSAQLVKVGAGIVHVAELQPVWIVPVRALNKLGELVAQLAAKTAFRDAAAAQQHQHQQQRDSDGHSLFHGRFSLIRQIKINYTITKQPRREEGKSLS